MKAFTVNIVSLIGFLVAFLTMYMNLPGMTLSPELIKVFSIVICIGTVVLKTPWFVSQDWKGGGFTVAIWAVNIAYLLIAVFTSLVDSSLMAAGVGMGIVTTLNLLITYFGGTQIGLNTVKK